jgi:SET domain-containing protein 6
MPRPTILSVENSILSSEIPAPTFQLLGPWLSLILVLLYEYHNVPSSFWTPYFAVLPTEFNTLMFWSDDELAELQASAVVGKIGREEADRVFEEELLPVIEEFSDIFFAGDQRSKNRAKEMRSPENLELMHKMGSLIMAYAFDIEPSTPSKDVDDEGFAEEEEDAALPKGMVPLADMLNADAERCNARLFYEKSGLEMRALKDIRAGEEVFNDYGALPRSDLLRRYGYVTDNNAMYDVVEIPVELVESLLGQEGAWKGERLQYLDEQDVLDSGYDIAASSPFTLQESLSPELIVLVEAMLLSEEDWDKIVKKGKLPKPEKMTPRGASVLLKIIQARIAQYATSLEEDLRSGEEVPAIDADVSTKQRRYAMAKAVRIGEKKLLAQAEEALKEMVARDGSKIEKRSREVDEEGDVEMGGTEKKHRR